MKYMEYAISEARKAISEGEVPIGAVIVKNDEIIAYAHNTTQQNKNSTCHAEINAINMACCYLKEKYLTECELYVTIEPCAMCAGAIINSKIKRVYIGAQEPKTGCCGSVINLLNNTSFNHNPEVYYGINEDECKSLMKNFFNDLR